ncbi:sulfurtransferase [Frateuria aurantia]
MIADVPPLISARALSTALQSPGLDLIDASVELPPPRFDGDYRYATGLAGWADEHIQGSRHVDLLYQFSDLQAGYGFALPAWETWPVLLDQLGFNPDLKPVIYDRSDGFWAARLWWMLESAGIRCHVLDGGMAAWKAAGLPSEQGHATTQSGRQRHTWSLRPRTECWADRKQVEAIVNGRQGGTLICALSEAMFHGTVPTRYSRRGHIPGSLNLPARSLLDSMGRQLSLGESAERVGGLLADAAKPWVIYCGGGISAAALALSLHRLGHSGVAVYDGSLQEWSADAGLPMLCGT